jgi:membrane protease YdiL (CAAX protease family)
MDHGIRLFRLRPDRSAAVAAAASVACIALSLLAGASIGTPLRPLLYHGLLILGMGFLFPAWYTSRREGRDLGELGLRRWPRALAVGAVLALLSPASWSDAPAWPLLYTAAALLLSGAFEELFFRGFVLPRLERAFGLLPALLLSSAAFSLYHLGYPRFDALPALLRMFAMGLVFALVFRVSGTVLASLAVNEVLAVGHFVKQGHLFSSAQLPLCALILGAGALWLRHIDRSSSWARQGRPARGRA